MIAWAIWLGCSAPATAPPQEELIFLRDAILSPDPVAGERRVGGDRSLIPRTWTPGETVGIGEHEAKAPVRPECAPLFQVELGDIRSLISMGRTAPDTALSWSPDASLLAIGTYRGEVLVADGWTGEVLSRRRLSEALIKRVAWSDDGSTLYVGEQSPDATLHALDVETLSDKWSLELGTHVGRSPMPADEDQFGIYDLPATYALEVLAGGDLLVVASHGWNDDVGERRNRARILRVSPEGVELDAWPAKPADALFLSVALDEPGDRLAVNVVRSASGPPPSDLPVQGVQVLRLSDLAPISGHQVAPLEPWFTQTYLWQALDIDRRHGLLMGFGDGRVRIEDPKGEPLLDLTTGAPVMAGEVPIAASVGFGFFLPDGLLYTTSSTNIPWGAAAPDLRPPTAHPNENALWIHDLDGSLRWTWRGPHYLQGAAVSPDGDTLVVGAGERQTDERRDLYGALLFALDGPDRSGTDRLESFCATEGPIFFEQALTPDGRVAVTEYPYLLGESSLHASYRATVFR